MKSTKKKLNGKGKVIKSSFTGNNITKYAGLNPLVKFMNREGVISMFSNAFPTEWKNATKFGIDQILLSIVLASSCGIGNLNKIAGFTEDGLVKILLKLQKGISGDTLSGVLKGLGEKGARKLSALLLAKNSKWLEKSKLKKITLDADSTVKGVYGNQEGAEKGYNPRKKGAKSYHPLLVFVSEMRLLYHSWFRAGSAYTSNGIVDFLKEVRASLPGTVENVLFRADSGFFNGKLFDLLESEEFGWDYLVKVKLRNLSKLLKGQDWEAVSKTVSICEFTYKGAGWKRSRTLKAVRTVDKYVEVDFFGGTEKVPVYKYACFISSYGEKDALELYGLYKKRSTSENWIGQVKSQAKAGSTLTNDFWANDILWQLAAASYNITLMMRSEKEKFKGQEHRTFAEWFINVPAKMVKGGRQRELKMYEHHFFREDWQGLAA